MRVTDVQTGQPLLTQNETEQARLAAKVRTDAKTRAELKIRLRELEKVLHTSPTNLQKSKA